MSWGKANVPTKSPKLAGIDSSDTATNEQGVPVPWWIGPDARPLTWIVPNVYNVKTVEQREKVGKGKTQTVGYKYYGDVAGIAGLGVVRRIWGFESDNEMVWQGSITRPDDPGHPNYWRASITTSVGKLHVYWGRPDQPVDDILLGPLGAANPSLAHPAYRNQVVVILQGYYLGQSGGNVPNTRLFLDREPVPELGSFPAQGHTQGESLPAGILELATNPIFGAGIPVERFTAAEWEALSAAVMANVGRHAPFLDRARPFRDVVRDFQGYYDGWCRLRNGKLQPGYFPHDGSVPAGLTELTVHDFVSRPRVRAGAPSKTVNDVVVVYRDRNDLLKKKPVNESASDNVEARRAHESKPIEMPGIVTAAQARAWAAEAAATGSEGEWEGEVRVRAPRAVWAGGAALQAGDNFQIDLIAPQVDQVSRIVRRSDPFAGPPTIEFVAERGVYPTPYLPPEDLRLEVGKILPAPIAQGRILELTPALAGSPLGIPITVLAKRPTSSFEEATLTSANVIGFNLWYSATGASYDTLGAMTGWAVRGVLREALLNSSSDAVVKIMADGDNLDLERLVAQSDEAQLNDNLLIVVGEELFSVGAIALNGLDYDLTCKRARLGSLPAAHALGAEAWIVWRDEIRPFLHSRFVEDEDRYFKLQPYTQSATIELSEIDPLLYHFRDRAPEKPVVAIDPLPASPVVGVSYSISGTISDVNGDLKSYQITAARLAAPGGAIVQEIGLLAGEPKPEDRALVDWRTRLVFPIAGTWKLAVRAYDERGAFREALSAEMTVSAGTGTYAPDDGLTPTAVSNVSVQGGFEMLWLEWEDPTNTPIAAVRVYEATTAVKPAAHSFIAPGGQQFLVRSGLPKAATRYYWLEAVGFNGRVGPVSGPHSGTTIAGVDLSDLVPGMTMVEIVDELPSSGNFKGRTVYLKTADGANAAPHLYEWTNDVIGTGKDYWRRMVRAENIEGQLTSDQIASLVAAKISGQLTNEQIAALDAAKLSGTLNPARIADGALAGAKLVDSAVSAAKLANDSVTAQKILAGSVGTGHLAAQAVTASKMLLTDLTDLVDNGGFVRGLAAWNNQSGIGEYAVAHPGWSTGSDDGHYLQITNPTNGHYILNQKITEIKEGDSFWLSFRAKKVGASLTGRVTVRLRLENSAALATGAFAWNSAIELLLTDASLTESWQTFAAHGVALAGAKAARLQVLIDQETVGTVRLTDLSARRRATAELIVDGAITAAKIGAGEVTTSKLAAQAITAEKLAIGTVTDNLVLNPGAEDGTTEGWGLVESSGASRTLSVNTTGVRKSGQNSFRISGSGIAAYGCRAVSVTPGQKLSVRVSTRAPTASATGLYLRFNEAANFPVGGFVTQALRDSFTNMIGNGPITTAWTDHAFTYTVPAGVYWVSFCIYAWSGSDPDVYFDDVELRRQVGVVGIEDGAITAEKLTADSVTATKIKAGEIGTAHLGSNVVTAQKIAAGTITASRMAIGGDTSNIYPDPDFMEMEGYYTSSAVWSFQAVAANAGPSKNQISVTGALGTGVYAVNSPFFIVEGGEWYLMTAWAEITGTGDQFAELRVYWYDTVNPPANGSGHIGGVILGVRSSTVPARIGDRLQAPSTAKMALLQFRREAGTTGNRAAVFSAPSVRMAADEDLLVDGAITAGKIRAGAVTADAVGTNQIIASAANIGDAVITGAKIGQLEVGEIRIANGAITNAVSTFAQAGVTIPSNGSAQVASITVVCTGRPVYLFGSVMVSPGPNSSFVQLQIRRNGSTIAMGNLGVAVTDTPGAGSFTYTLWVLDFTGFSFSAQHRSLFAIETKK